MAQNEPDRKAPSAWAPYAPTPEAPWNLARVVHLYRRTAFGAPWKQVTQDLADGPKAAVTRLLEGKLLEDVPEDFDQLAEVIGGAAAASGVPGRLKAWWLYRCLFTPYPLQERLTLMWHNHFATSQTKVQDLAAMKQQNETFRRLALAPFGELLAAALRDPALLAYLDAPANRAGQPNENLGRELLELFSLGVGHYSEADVKDAARALTGWTARLRRFEFQEGAHDAGEKTILGKTGTWSPD